MKMFFVVLAMAIGMLCTNAVSAQNASSNKLEKIENDIEKKSKKEARLERKLEKKQNKLEKSHKKLKRQERKVHKAEKKKGKEEKRLRKQQDQINNGATGAAKAIQNSNQLIKQRSKNTSVLVSK